MGTQKLGRIGADPQGFEASGAPSEVEERDRAQGENVILDPLLPEMASEPEEASHPEVQLCGFEGLKEDIAKRQGSQIQDREVEFAPPSLMTSYRHLFPILASLYLFT